MRNDTSTQRLHFLAKFFILFLLLFSTQQVFSQYDYEHYVPPFYDGSSDNYEIGKHTVVLSTNSATDVHVDIFKGIETTPFQTVTISRSKPYEYVFRTPKGNDRGTVGSAFPETYDFPLTVVGPRELNKRLDRQGLRFKSNDNPFFVNIRHISQIHGCSATTKGTYAYGTDFRTGHMFAWDYGFGSAIRRSHFISIMATEDTDVTISDIKIDYLTFYEKGRRVFKGGYYRNDPVYLKPINKSDEIKVHLNKGQSYVIGVDFDEGTEANIDDIYFSHVNREKLNSLNGTHIVSTKPIVVNTGSWTAGKNRSQDIGVDQIVPIKQVKDKYILIKGLGTSEEERPIVVATEDNTEVYVNGSKKATLLKAGDFKILENAYSVDGFAYIDTKGKSTYMYQSLAGSSKKPDATRSMSFIPPLSSIGIKIVTVPYADELAKSKVENSEITILTEADARVEYEQINKAGNVIDKQVLPKTSAHRIFDTKWVCYRFNKRIKGSYRFSSNKAINVGWLARNKAVGAGGYFSGFTKAISKIVPNLTVSKNMELMCQSYTGADGKQDVVVKIQDPLPDFYEWYKDDLEGDVFIANGPLVLKKAPDKETLYHVKGYYRDVTFERMVNGDFSIGHDFFNSEYPVSWSIYTPGEFMIVPSPNYANPEFIRCNSEKGGNMFVAYSKTKGDKIYEANEIQEISEKYSYILKVTGRLVKKNEHFKTQFIDVLVNDEVVIDNFKMDSPDDWKSIQKLWKPKKGVTKARIKIVNANEGGSQSVFAIDEVSFVRAVEDTDVFVARVVPNYSYDDHGGRPYHFCENQEGSIDASNGTTTWFNYSWSRKKLDGTYQDLVNGAEFDGVKTHILKFKDAKIKHQGKYKCTISFKDEFAKCGATPESNATVEYDVQIDEAVVLSMEEKNDKKVVCYGTESATFKAKAIKGSAGELRWFLKHPGDADYRDDIVSVGSEYSLPKTLPAGIYSVKCLAVNGCGNVSIEKSIEILAAPNLTNLTFNDPVCMGDEVILTATATPDAMPKRFLWFVNKRPEVLNLTNQHKFIASEATKGTRFTVTVSGFYYIDGETKYCKTKDPDLSISWDDLKIGPKVELPDLLGNTYCEGESSHTFTASTKNDDDYTFKWAKDGAVIAGADQPTYTIPNVELVNNGTYTVTAKNKCNDEQTKTATINVTQRLVVTSITANKPGPFCGNTAVDFAFVDNGAVNKYQVKNPTDADFRDITLTGNKYTATITNATQGEWKFRVKSNCGSHFEKSFNFSLIPDFGAVSMNDVVTCIGESASFNVNVAGVDHLTTLTYAWQKDGNPIAGDKPSLMISDVKDADAGNYTCTVTDQCGRAKAITKTLVIEKVTAPSSAPQREVCVGEKNVSFTANIIGDLATTTFEWRRNGTIVGTNQKYNIASVTTANAGNYTCKITLNCGVVTTINRKLIVNEHISIAATTQTIDICQKEQPTLKVNITGDPTKYSIVWKDNADNVIAGTNDHKQIVLPKQNTPGTFTYKAIVTGKCETLTKVFTLKVHKQATIDITSPVLSCSGNVELSADIKGEYNSITWWKSGVKVTDTDGDDKKLSLVGATSANNGTYIVKVDANDNCVDKQASTELKVTDGIIVDSKSTATPTVCEGSELVLEVKARGTVKYKWYKTTAPTVQLSDKQKLVLTNISNADEGVYRCELSNDQSCGNQTHEFTVTVHTKPVITKQPSDKVLCSTAANTTFTVVATTEGATSYQWYKKDDTKITGATAASYTVTTLINGEGYYCIVKGADACSTHALKSRIASITLLQPATVIEHPKDLTIADGADASFSVRVSGEGPFEYQWQELLAGKADVDANWTNLNNTGKYSGTKTNALAITNALIDPFNNNRYRCVVTTRSICGNVVKSNAARLRLTEVVKISKQPINLKQLCFNSTFSLSIEGKKNGLVYTWQYKKPGGTFIDADGKEGMSATTTGKVSSLRIPTNDLKVNTWKFRCIVSDGISTPQTSNESQIKVLQEVVVTTTDKTFTPCLNSPFQIPLNVTGEEITYKWYEKTEPAKVLSRDKTFNFGSVKASFDGTYVCEINNTQNCYPTQKREFIVDVHDVAKITKQPYVDPKCNTATEAELEVEATSDSPITYQWVKNGVEIRGATAKKYKETTLVNASIYKCKLTNACGVVETNAAVIAVVDQLTATNPANVTIPVGSTATFKVKAQGEPTYQYQWEEKKKGATWQTLTNSATYAGVTTDVLKVKNVDQANFHESEYRCIVTSTGSICTNRVETNPAILKVLTVDKIIDQPDDIEVCEGTTDVKFEVERKDEPGATYTYTWEYKETTSATFLPVTAASLAPYGLKTSVSGRKSILTLTNAEKRFNNWKFRCKVDNGVEETSNEVTLTVDSKIVALVDKAAVPTCEKGSLEMTVKTTSGDALHYKWYKEGASTDIKSTAIGYTISDIQLANEGKYICEVYNNSACPLDKVEFNVDVRENAKITKQPTFTPTCEDDNAVAVINATIEGGGAPTYTWYDKDNNVVTDTDGNNATLTVVAKNAGEQYYCIVSGPECANVKSNIAPLTVKRNVQITKQPATKKTISDASSVEFSVDAVGTGAITYQWEKSKAGAAWSDVPTVVGDEYSGEKSKTLRISPAKMADWNNTKYRCKVHNECHDVTSDEALLDIKPLIKIAKHPNNIQVCLGASKVFEVEGTSTGLDYKWEYKIGAGTFKSVTGVTGLSVIDGGKKLKITAATLAMKTWKFRCVVDDRVSSPQNSDEVVAEIFEPVTFDNIAKQDLCFGDTKRIDIKNLAGTGTFTYKWTKDGVVAPLSDKAFLNLGADANGIYHVSISNAICPVVKKDFEVKHYKDLKLAKWTNVDKVCIGTPENLEVTFDQIEMIPGNTRSYVWEKDGVALASVGAIHTVPALNKTEKGQYAVTVSDGCSTEKISGFVSLYQPISTTENTNPAKIDICLNNELKLAVDVKGDVTSYVWKHTYKGVTKTLATTGKVLIVSKIKAVEAGTYTCVVSGECGAPITYTFNVEVVQIPDITTGLTDSQICEGELLKIGSIAVNPATRIENIVWETPAGITKTLEDNDKRLNLGNADLNEEGYYKVTVSNMCGKDIAEKRQIVNPLPAFADLKNQEVCQGEDVTFEAIATGRKLAYKWYVDGAAQTETSNQLQLKNVQPTNVTTPKIVAIKCEITNLNACGAKLVKEATLTVNPSTILTSTLPNQTVYVTSTHSISLTATGVNLNYEWKHESGGTTTTLTGEKASTIILNKVQKKHAGIYHCKITGTCGDRSASGILTVKELIIIKKSLSALKEICEGEQLNLATTVSGAVKSVEWYKVEGGVEKPLKNPTLSYTINKVTPADAGEYICRISGEGIDDIEQKCLVRVSKITRLDESLGNVALCENKELDWEAKVTSDASAEYKWYFNGGTTAVATGRILNIKNVSVADEGNYEIQVKGKCGDVSSRGHLEVVTLPTFVKISPDLLNICEGTEVAEFKAEFTGENLSYQWYKEGNPIAGETKPTLEIRNVKISDAGNYHCRVHSESGCGDLISTKRRMTVTPKLQILEEPLDQVICAKQNVQFRIKVLGSGVKYQWTKNGANIDHATSSSLEVMNASVGDRGYYTCVVSDRCTDARNSRLAELTVNRLPKSEILGRLKLCAKEDRVTYSTITIPDINYSWSVIGGIFEGPKSGEKTRVTWGEADKGKLSLLVVNDDTGCRSEISENIELNPLPTVTINNYKSKGLCENKFELTGGIPAGGIYWVDGISEEDFNPKERGAGEYKVKYSYTDKNGCSNVTEEKILKIDALPTVDITDDTTIGSCKPFKLSAVTTEDNIKWYEKKEGSLQLAEGMDDNTSMTPTLTPTISKTFVAKVLDEHGCNGVDLVNITVAPLPEIKTIKDTVVGQCNQLQLLTDIVGNAGKITWNHADHLDNASVRSPKIVSAPEGKYVYQIDVEDLYGCKASGNVAVEIHKDPKLPEDKTGCEGQKFEIDTKGMSNPVWNDGNKDVVRSITKAGKYVLKVSNKFGCGDEQKFTMDPLPKITMKDSAIIFEGQTLTLSNNFPIKYGPYAYDWKVNQDKESVSIQPTYTVDKTGKYTLTVTDHLGCKSTKTTEVTVKPVGIESPTAFTPLSGGAFKNDRFYLKEINVVKTFEMFIYNRWGELVFQSKEVGYDGGWDGTYKGELCPTGAYVWVVFINGKKTNNGTFMLLR